MMWTRGKTARRGTLAELPVIGASSREEEGGGALLGKRGAPETDVRGEASTETEWRCCVS